MTNQTPGITPAQFVEKWERAQLKERASYQEHFNDVCRLVGHPTPAEKDPTGEEMTFEYGVKKLGGEQGYADVFYRGHFAIEYKGKGKYSSLDEAYRQLQQYRENLLNPPLLIVCDIENWEIHTNWPNTEKKVYRFKNQDLLRPFTRRILHNLFFEPNALHPNRTADEVTADAAEVFRQIADDMRKSAQLRDEQPDPARIAHFLTKLVFCLFAEDVGLLPTLENGNGIFTDIVEKSRQRPTIFTRYMSDLFTAMRDGGEMFYERIRWFDGRLFENVVVEELSLEALTGLERASHLDWSSVQPAIFGTLFERSLDPGKRAQLGAHYTSEDDIRLIVEPVLMLPLRQEWERIQQEAAPIREALDSAPNRSVESRYRNQLTTLREEILAQLREIEVLDPACGSGNFLYVSLQSLLDLEKAVLIHPLWEGLPTPFPEVHPRQLYGIEINPIAHDLASIVVWIGYIQWNQNNGYLSSTDPILEPLDNIELKDAILGVAEDGTLYDPEWPRVDVIVSNPPFLGAKWMQREFGEAYTTSLRTLFEHRISGTADLVMYWFEKARDAIVRNQVKRVGLLATNTIRQGGSAQTLERIKQTGDIFFAYVDHPWILDGAALRISLVGFDNGTEEARFLNDSRVTQITSDLTGSLDLANVKSLTKNTSLSFRGHERGGPFLIDSRLAKDFLLDLRNSEVVHPWYSGQDVTGRPRQEWVIDFGTKTEDEAQALGAVFQFLQAQWQKEISEAKGDSARRIAKNRKQWWLHRRPATDLREAVGGLKRLIVTPLVSKHRIFVWINVDTRPDTRLVVFAREDDYFFGVLHSRLHEYWSLRLGARHGGERPTYNNTTCFETFPFPWPPGQEDTDHPAYKAISAAAQQLHEERDAWLNPPGVTSEKALKNRTLTNLYNALNVWRGLDTMKVKPEAADFAPRLDELHQALDRAVCDAYGWPHEVLADEEEILRRLLALNLERAGKQAG